MMYIKLRMAHENDWDFILKLRNQFYNIAFFDQKKLITKNEHFEYMQKQIKNSDFFHWIASSEKIDVGYIRILDEDVSIMVEEKFHNKGVGTIMLKLLENEARSFKIKKMTRIEITNNGVELLAIYFGLNNLCTCLCCVKYLFDFASCFLDQ